MPSPDLVYLVTGQYSIEAFYDNGVIGYDSIVSMLARNKIDQRALATVLDFGCGCGRVMRHWSTCNVLGCDYNPELVSWCDESLPFATVSVNGTEPPLQYGDSEFDFTYVISVFTHLKPELQVPWFSELARVLKPGGYLYVTFHGSSHLDKLTDDDKRRFSAGDLVVINEEHSGTNACAVFHPEGYVRRTFGSILDLVDFVPVGAKDASQDAYLFRRA